MPLDTAVTERAARILIERDPGPGDRLDAFLLLAGQEYLWRSRDRGGASSVAGKSPSGSRAASSAGCTAPMAGAALPRRTGVSDGSLSICLGLPYETALKEPPRSLPHAERRVTELALANVVDPGVEGVAREPHG